MTMIKNTKKKNIVIAIACCLVLLVGAMSAYFFDTDSSETTMTVGEVSVELTHPLCDAADTEKENIVPNQELTMDPAVTNNGANDAFVFVRVQVPKVTDVTMDDDGVLSEASTVDLFGYDLDDDWVLVDSDTTGDDFNEYVYAYGTSEKCTALAPEASTSVLFDGSKMTVANIQGYDELFGSDVDINISVEAIQAEWTKSDAPAGVLAIIENMTAEE